jgi:site-specific DNA-cytosine methylase
VAEKLNDIAKDLGYTTTLYKTNTLLHGIPQYRERTFMYFWKEDNRVPVLGYWNRDRKSAEEYLKEIPKGATGDTTNDRDKMLPAYLEFAKLKNFDWRTELPQKHRHFSRWLAENDYLDEFNEYCAEHYPDGSKSINTAMNRVKRKSKEGKGWWEFSPGVERDDFIHTITTKLLALIVHPTEDRFLTSREAMHLMGMPHDMELLDWKKHEPHITQNVPTCTARDITLNALEYIDGKTEFIECQMTKQNNHKRKVELTSIIAEDL